ncbi:MAG TPA: GNAT family protein [Pyrinomonadaceae bacterium]
MSEPIAAPPQSNHGSPLLSTRRIRLRVITDRDSIFLYDLMTSPQAGGRVRFAGATPSPEKIAASLWDSVLAQFIIEGSRSQKPLGLVAVTSPNFRDGFAYISALGPTEAQGLGLIAEGVLLGFHYAFSTWPFRKIYMEATEESYKAFKSGLDRFFVQEGQLREHVFWNGRFMNLMILAVYRETWARQAPTVLRRLHAED